MPVQFDFTLVQCIQHIVEELHVHRVGRVDGVDRLVDVSDRSLKVGAGFDFHITEIQYLGTFC